MRTCEGCCVYRRCSRDRCAIASAVFCGACTMNRESACAAEKPLQNMLLLTSACRGCFYDAINLYHHRYEIIHEWLMHADFVHSEIFNYRLHWAWSLLWFRRNERAEPGNCFLRLYYILHASTDNLVCALCGHICSSEPSSAVIDISLVASAQDRKLYTFNWAFTRTESERASYEC